MSSTGVANLCKGLRTNMTLKQLHMQFCNITHEGGKHIAELLANSRSALEVVNLNGNRLGGLGGRPVQRADGEHEVRDAGFSGQHDRPGTLTALLIEVL